MLQKAQNAGVLSGLNIPNKKPGEPLIEWVAWLGYLSWLWMVLGDRLFALDLPAGGCRLLLLAISLHLHVESWHASDVGNWIIMRGVVS